MPLTPKQQRFVDEYLIDLNATQAAIRAGYSERTAKSVGSENLTKPDIAAAVRAQQQKRAQRAEWSAADRLAALKRISDAAEEQDPRVAVSAIGEANKMQGSHAPAKHQHSGAIGTYDLTKLSDDELNRLESILGPLALAGGDQSGEGEATG